jgi:hypothetical protein
VAKKQITMTWKPLPVIVYGFAIHPLTSSSASSNDPSQRPPGRLSTVLELEHEEDDANPYVVALEVGDEVYAFEEYVGEEDNGAWYRGSVRLFVGDHSVDKEIDMSCARLDIHS